MFLRREVIARRHTVFAIMREIDDLSARTFNAEQAIINARRTEFGGYLLKMSALAVFFALAIAAVSIFRVSALERRGELQRRRAESAEKGLRQLSQQLVQAQEEERKRISRELHDEITDADQAQDGLASLEALATVRNQFQEHLRETRMITERTMRSVRGWQWDCALDAG